MELAKEADGPPAGQGGDLTEAEPEYSPEYAAAWYTLADAVIAMQRTHASAISAAAREGTTLAAVCADQPDVTYLFRELEPYFTAGSDDQVHDAYMRVARGETIAVAPVSRPAWWYALPMTAPAIVLHVPHSSPQVPADVRPQLLLDDDDLARELRRMTDWHTEALFSLPADEAVTVRLPVSRLVVDPGHLADAAAERMEAAGMGVVHTKTSDGARLRDEEAAARDRTALLERYCRPHLEQLEAATAAALQAHGRCLVIDCHSFPSLPLPYEFKASADRWRVVHRPAVCLGTDTTLPPHAPFAHPGMHTPPWLRERAAEALGNMLANWPGGVAHDPASAPHEPEPEGAGRAVADIAFDRPFAGTLVPPRFRGNDRRVQALRIDLRRDLYMDEDTGDRVAGFAACAAAVQAALRRIVA